MSDPARTAPSADATTITTVKPVKPITPITPLKTTAPANDDKMPCDRCGVDMYRMHAVWRCPACGYKTDCCGW
jgi:hypothetical protein